MWLCLIISPAFGLTSGLALLENFFGPESNKTGREEKNVPLSIFMIYDMYEIEILSKSTFLVSMTFYEHFIFGISILCIIHFLDLNFYCFQEVFDGSALDYLILEPYLSTTS